MRARITQRLAETAAPQDRPYEILDTDLTGFIMRVQPTGVRSFIVRWGRGKRLTLGRYPVMTVGAARAAALAALAQAMEHGAPQAVIDAAKPVSTPELTLGAFIADHYAPWALANMKAGAATVASLGNVWASLYEMPLDQLRSVDIERVRMERLKIGRKPATVNRDLDRIRGVLSRAVDWGMLDEHPMRTVRRSRGGDETRVRYLDDDEAARLRAALAARDKAARAARERANAWRQQRGQVMLPIWPEDGFSDHLTPIVLLALNTGMRRGEILQLRWEHINLRHRLLTIVAANAKSGRARHLPLNDEAMMVLQRWGDQTGRSGLVFSGPGDGPMGHVRRGWASVVKAAALENFRFHDLRHDFASKLVMAGVDLNTVRELLGHANLETTLRYAHLSPRKLADAVSLLGAQAASSSERGR